MLKDVILQGGCIQCPICSNTFKWSFKLELISTDETESLNKASTAIDCSPHSYITPIATVDKKVRFLIACEKCDVNIETDPMELISQDNYNRNKS